MKLLAAVTITATLIHTPIIGRLVKKKASNQKFFTRIKKTKSDLKAHFEQPKRTIAEY